MIAAICGECAQEAPLGISLGANALQGETVVWATAHETSQGFMHGPFPAANANIVSAALYRIIAIELGEIEKLKAQLLQKQQQEER